MAKLLGALLVASFGHYGIAELPGTVADTCSVFQVKDSTCFETAIDCNYVEKAMKFDKDLVQGMCSSQGYTVKGEESTRTVPFVGKLTITEYTKPAIVQDEKNLFTCSVFQVVQDTACFETAINCMYAGMAMKIDKHLKHGKCSRQGFTVFGKTFTDTVPVLGTITVTEYEKPGAVQASVAADTCSVFQVKDSTCFETAINCDYVEKAMTFDKNLKRGKCSRQGYTVFGKKFTDTVPVLGTITVTEYEKPGAVQAGGAADTCSVFQVKDSTCFETAINCNYVEKAMKFDKDLVQGMCSSQGYTVKGEETTKTVPVIGKLTIAKYTKPAVAQDVVLMV